MQPKAARVLQPLAPSANANPLDVLKIKSALGALGHYKAPDWGLSQFPEPALFKAIEAFQRKRGLNVDGVMKPGGPTEASLHAALTPHQKNASLYSVAKTLQGMGREGDTLLAHITPEEAQLLDAITDGASVNPNTGLLEFWSGKGGYSGPDRTYASKDSDRTSSFDASADHKAMQKSVAIKDDNGSRTGSDSRASGGQETVGGGSDLTATKVTSTTEAADSQTRARAARTVIAPDNDPSFTGGFFEKKTTQAKPTEETSVMLRKTNKQSVPVSANPASSNNPPRNPGKGFFESLWGDLNSVFNAHPSSQVHIDIPRTLDESIILEKARRLGINPSLIDLKAPLDRNLVEGYYEYDNKADHEKKKAQKLKNELRSLAKVDERYNEMNKALRGAFARTRAYPGFQYHGYLSDQGLKDAQLGSSVGQFLSRSIAKQFPPAAIASGYYSRVGKKAEEEESYRQQLRRSPK